MNFLPVVQRELLQASRRKAHFWGRVAVALIGVLVGAVVMASATLNGHDLFQVLTFLAFGAASLSGVFLTADTVRFERREGTLGLLFLTNLRGYDIVLGKLASASLNILLGLLALCPVFSITWLLGGVSWQEFWCTCGALLATLVFSLSVGMAVSSWGRETGPALVVTVLIVGAFTLVCPVLVDYAQNLGFARRLVSVLRANPWNCLQAAQDFASPNSLNGFYFDFLGLVFWTFAALIFASWMLARRWQDDVSGRPTDGRRSRPLLLRIRPSRSMNRALLDRNPVAALVGYSSAVKGLLWGVGVTVITIAAFSMLPPGVSSGAPAWGAILGILFVLWQMLLVLLISWQATGFFSDGMRSGWLELLVTTPMGDKAIVSGQWIILRRVFGLPVLGFVLAGIAGSLGTGSAESEDGKIMCFFEVSAFLNMVAAACVGLVMGLRNARREIAFLKTIGVLLLSKLTCFYAPFEQVAMILISGSFMMALKPGVREIIDRGKIGHCGENSPRASASNPQETLIP